MNQRIVVGLLIAGGLGIGLFAAAERVMRNAGRRVTVVDEPPVDPPQPVTLVSSPPKKSPPPVATPAPGGVPAVPVAGGTPPAAVVPPANVPGVPVIERLAVCLGVKDRNPVGESDRVSLKSGRVYCWMRIASGTGKKVRAVWTLNGRKWIGAWIPVTSDSFRTWTTRKLDSGSVGAGLLEIQDQAGKVLATKEFSVVKK